MATTYRFSARVLHFPATCCCCRGHGATSRWNAGYTRVTGKRVVRTDTRAWSFPICGRCLRWIELLGEVPRAKRRHASWIAGLVLLLVLAGSSALVTPLICCGGLLSATGAATPTERTSRPERNTGTRPSKDSQPPNPAGVSAAGVVCAGFFAVTAAGLGALAWPVRNAVRRAGIAVASAVDAAAKARPAGAADPNPVTYHGWNGSIHTFTFENSRYADDFRATNAGKWVG